MKQITISRLVLLAALLAPLATLKLSAQTTGKLVVPGEVDSSKLIPISMSGFSGEVATVLKFDLEVMGFKFEGPDTAQFLLSGSNNDRVEGRLTDRINKASLLAKAYTGGTQRSQAHALADDIVLAITGKKGIAQTKIAFKVDTGGKSEIYVADYDGHSPQAVTKDNTLVAAPCWVPGRFALYYTSYKAGYPEIFSHDLSSGARRAVAQFGSLNTSAALSADGKRLAFISNKAGAPNVYVCDANGGNLKRLTTTKEGESSPCWSPDGQTICFTSRISGRAALYTVSASGGAMKRLTTGVSNATEPDWSPDGKTIVFTAQMGAFNICTVPAGGGTAAVLVAGQDPCWAPNSRTVIFVRGRGNDLSLSLLDVPTKQVKNVSRISGSNSQPNWAK
jgi:TolB protein